MINHDEKYFQSDGDSLQWLKDSAFEFTIIRTVDRWVVALHDYAASGKTLCEACKKLHSKLIEPAARKAGAE